MPTSRTRNSDVSCTAQSLQKIIIIVWAPIHYYILCRTVVYNYIPIIKSMIYFILVDTDLLSCSIGLSWVNFVSPMGLGCWCSWWWWFMILISPDTAALGWCGPRWNPTAMPSSNSSTSTVPLMLYYNILYSASLSLRPASTDSPSSSSAIPSSSCVHTTGHFFFFLFLFYFISLSA